MTPSSARADSDSPLDVWSRRRDPIELSVINVITIMISSSDSSGGLSHDKLLLRVHDHMLLRDGETGGGGGGRGGGEDGRICRIYIGNKVFLFFVFVFCKTCNAYTFAGYHIVAISVSGNPMGCSKICFTLVLIPFSDCFRSACKAWRSLIL